MKCVVCLLALAVWPASAEFIHVQSPPNGNAVDFTNARLADDFHFSGAAEVTAVDFWFQTDVFGSPSDLSSVAWAFYRNSGGALGSELYNGIATPATSVDATNNADFASFNVPDLIFKPGVYWLELHAGSSLTDNNGGITVWWSNIDANAGMAALQNTSLGLPDTPLTGDGTSNMAFELEGLGGSVDHPFNPTPEPSGFLVLATGLPLVLWWRKRAR